MKTVLDDKIHALLDEKLRALEKHFNADVLTYFGSFEGGENMFLRIVEYLANDERKSDTIYIVLTTGGGSANVVERYVETKIKWIFFMQVDYQVCLINSSLIKFLPVNLMKTLYNYLSAVKDSRKWSYVEQGRGLPDKNTSRSARFWWYIRVVSGILFLLGAVVLCITLFYYDKPREVRYIWKGILFCLGFAGLLFGWSRVRRLDE